MKLSAKDWIKVDLANHLGHDKITFPERIALIGSTPFQNLQEAACNAKDKYQATKAFNAFQDIFFDHKTHSDHIMNLDACASGLQLFAVLTGDYNAALVTGLVDPNVRKDAYTEIINLMNQSLPADQQIGSQSGITRKAAKDAIMPHFYGSRAEPTRIFGKGIVRHQFYRVMDGYFPETNKLYQTLVDIWDSSRKEYHWMLPDGHYAVMPVTQKVSATFATRSLGGAVFNHVWESSMPIETSVKLVANVIHSVDGYVVREMIVRAMMPRSIIDSAILILRMDLLDKQFSKDHMEMLPVSVSRITDMGWILAQSYTYKWKLLQELEYLVERPVFQIQTVHDSFRASPRYMNLICEYYRHILAEIADSNLADHLLLQLCGRKLGGVKRNLSKYVLNSVYGLS